MLQSSLHLPDHPDWHHEDNYSPEAAAALKDAYEAIARGRGTVESYLEAYARVVPFRDDTISNRQRMLVCNLLARAYLADEDYVEAFHAIGEALEQALYLRDDGAQHELFTLRGSLYRARLLFSEAVQDFEVSLDILREHARDGQPLDPSQEARLLAMLAGFEVYLMEYDSAEQRLREAERLARAHRVGGLEGATVEWIWANLLRTRGELDLALRHILTAADTYAQLDNALNGSRSQSLAAEIALDLADTYPADALSYARDAYITLAGPYARRAWQLARESKNVSSIEMARLAKVRYDRMRGNNVDAIVIIEKVIRTAQGLGDTALQADAGTALGRELMRQGEVESALSTYRRVLDTVRGSDVTGLAATALKELIRASQLRDDDGRG